MWPDENQVGTDCSKEAKNTAEILVIMENAKCFYIRVFIALLALPTNQRTVSNSEPLGLYHV